MDKDFNKIKQEIYEIIKQEGDELSFRYEGYKCNMRRNSLGGWCAYVYIPIKPFENAILSYKVLNTMSNITVHEEDYFNNFLYPHGGITYFEKENWAYVIGFDCCHHNDLVPVIFNYMPSDSEYRTKKYVMNECKKMIQKVRRIIKNPPLNF